ISSFCGFVDFVDLIESVHAGAGARSRVRAYMRVLTRARDAGVRVTCAASPPAFDRDLAGCP
ncbi:MAG: hypothetical protein KGL42_02095, partial [Betaproteobacteria bacterium]|nr:hypothetical protein [Betaproteobacteria bacterium]